MCLLDGVEVPCGNGTTGEYTTPDLSDGRHSFSVSSVDPLGNKGRPVTAEWETGEQLCVTQLSFCVLQQS